VLSVVAFLMLAFCFFTTKERIQVPPSTTSMREDLRDIWRNDQWRIVGVLTILNILAVCVRGGAMMYYCTWIMGSPEVFVAFLTTYCVGNLIGSALAKPLTDWKCKVSIFWWTNAALAVVSVAMFFVPMHAKSDVRLYLRHWRAAPAGDADPVGDDVRHRRLRRMDQRQTPDRHQLCGHAVRAEARPGAGRRADRLDAGRRRLRRRSQNPEQRDHQHHYRPVHPRPGGLLRAERHYRQTLLHAENPFLTKMMGELAQGARRNQQEFENLPVSKELQN
jgi:GPH family glycoside/pentoside/hexuronide:cation symporter